MEDNINVNVNVNVNVKAPVQQKRGRKPKASKEEHSNIDSVTLENSQLENSQLENSQLEHSQLEHTVEPPVPIVKTPVKRVIKKKEKASVPAIIPTTVDDLLDDTNANVNTTAKSTPEEQNEEPDVNKIIPTDLNYSTQIKQIYHISDLHIQLYKRHTEYQEVFNRVYEYLRLEKKKYGVLESNNTKSPLIVVLTGDILHSKSDLSPECIQMTYNFIKTLASIMPLVMIAGNHDININNRDRLDAITPIIADLPKSYPIYYLLETGVYRMANIMFYHASIFDYKIINPKQVKLPTQNQNGILDNNNINISIMLYHGRVNGAVLFNGMAFTDANSAANNKTITPSTFEPYDITLLGDIHKHQFLAQNIAYAGSLIQQNMGEDINNHGLIKWDVKTRRGELVQIPNNWSYVTMLVENKRANYLCTMSDGKHNPECKLTKNLRVRILYKNTPESYLSDYITLLKMNHNILEYAWQNDDANISLLDAEQSANQEDPNQPAQTQLQSTTNSAPKQANSLIDITSPDVQNKYIVEYLMQNEPTITQDDINEIKNMNISQNTVLKESNKIYNNSAFNGHYKIKRLEFSNLFSFGGNNILDFSEFKGIVGIIAANHLGKSSIIDIIIYTLFDEFTRKGSTKDIININKDDFHIKMDIGIGQWTYTIIKSGYRTKVGASVRVEFYRINDVSKTMERLEEDNATKTKERIAEYFGCYEDIIHTSFSIQHDNSCFIDSSNIKRKDELERIMRFEIVKKLYEMANQKYNKDKAVYDHIKKKINKDEIVEIKKAKTRASRLLNIIVADKEYVKEKIKLLHLTILETSKKLHTECNKFMEENTKEDTQDEFDITLHNIESNAEKIKLLQSELIHNLENIDIHKDDMGNFNIARITEKLNDDENKNNDVIKDANKKIKIIDNANEKLYKTRKPCNIKIPSNSSQLEYLEELKNKFQNEIANYSSQIDKLNLDIDRLRENEKQIEVNNDKILELEKQMNKNKLPEELLSVIENIDELEENYNIALEEFVLDITENNITNFKQNIPSHLNNMDSYKEFQSHAQKYYLAKAIKSYQSNQSNNSGSDGIQLQEELIQQQSNLELDNAKLKQELKEIKQLEMQIKQLDVKKISVQNQITLILADIDNMGANDKIDEEIGQNKLKRNKYEKRVEDMEKKQNEIKVKLRKVRDYEDILLKQSRLEIDLERLEVILCKFETYQQQIEENKPILETISKLKAELSDFEEVLELIENQYTTEQANVIKFTSQLEQLKRDLQEGREMERKMRISEFYRGALKQLPYILLAKIQPILEKKVNDLLTITTDFIVKFDMSDSKIDIYLDRSIYKDKTRNIIINNASGFERFMASLAIRMALLELSNLPKINFMAIDEGWSSFDTHNINNVSVILDYLTSKFDFVLTISHLIQIKEHCDIQLSLKKDDYGFSKIVY